MKQEPFVATHEPLWQRLEAWLDEADPARRDPDVTERFPALYRQLCQHLALARERLYSHHLVERLDRLVLRAHPELYRRQRRPWQALARYVLADFPRQVRRRWKLVLLSAALFYGPLLGMLGAIQIDPDMVYTVFDGEQVRMFERMYDPAARQPGREPARQADSDLLMFGYYVRNNTGIGLRTFASGLLFGIGTLLVLIFNGLYIGAAAGHLTQMGYGETFWTFVAGHSGLELNAIVLSGAAGLQLGLAVLAPGRRTRLRALRDEALDALQLVYGAAGMFLLAALVEAFWSPRPLPSEFKIAVGIALFALVIAYFLLAGRRRRAA